MNQPTLSNACVEESVNDIDQLCFSEYGIHLVDLLNDPKPEFAARRMRRLSGILLKRDFAEPQPIGQRVTKTDAKHAWIWQTEKLESPENPESAEYQLLEKLRGKLPEYFGLKETWHDFELEVDSERGLFKVLALYLDDVITNRKRKTFREYYAAKESPPFKAMVDLSNAVFNCAMTPVYASLLPVPGLVVAISLIGIQFGYDSIFNAAEERDDRN